MAALTDLTLADLSKAMARKEASAVEVADAHLKKLDEHRALNAFITETPDKAREVAKASDARRAKGEAGLRRGAPPPPQAPISPGGGPGHAPPPIPQARRAPHAEPAGP